VEVGIEKESWMLFSFMGDMSRLMVLSLPPLITVLISVTVHASPEIRCRHYSFSFTIVATVRTTVYKLRRC
jgi:hypothetical protein